MREEYKGRTATLNTIVEQSMLSDLEFRELMTEILGEMAGTPFEGLRTLDPSEVRYGAYEADAHARETSAKSLRGLLARAPPRP